MALNGHLQGLITDVAKKGHILEHDLMEAKLPLGHAGLLAFGQ